MHASGQYNKQTNPYDVSVNAVIGAGTGIGFYKDAFVILEDSRVLLNPDAGS